MPASIIGGCGTPPIPIPGSIGIGGMASMGGIGGIPIGGIPIGGMPIGGIPGGGIMFGSKWFIFVSGLGYEYMCRVCRLLTNCWLK
jgi:hypothetical protein